MFAKICSGALIAVICSRFARNHSARTHAPKMPATEVRATVRDRRYSLAICMVFPHCYSRRVSEAVNSR